MPCHAMPAITFSTSELTDFAVNRLFMKLFKTNNIEMVEFCQRQFGFDKPNILWARRVRKFDSKFITSKNAFVNCII